MGYKFEWSSRAQAGLASLDRIVARRILKKIIWFSNQPAPFKYAVRLRPPAIGDARFRIGDYRVVVVLDQKDQRIVIAAVGHRREVYRG